MALTAYFKRFKMDSLFIAYCYGVCFCTRRLNQNDNDDDDNGKHDVTVKMHTSFTFPIVPKKARKSSDPKEQWRVSFLQFLPQLQQLRQGEVASSVWPAQRCASSTLKLLGSGVRTPIRSIFSNRLFFWGIGRSTISLHKVSQKQGGFRLPHHLIACPCFSSFTLKNGCLEGIHLCQTHPCIVRQHPVIISEIAGFFVTAIIVDGPRWD